MINKISLILLGVTTGFLALLYYNWQQFTNLPTWYTQPITTSEKVIFSSNQNTLQQAITQLENKVNSQIIALETTNQTQSHPDSTPFNTSPIISNTGTPPLKENEIEIPLNETELNALVLSNLTQEKAFSPFLSSIKGINTTIQNGKLETGLVVNLQDIPTEKLAISQQATLKQIKQLLNQQEIYLKIESQPQLINHKLQLNPNTQIKLGTLKMTLTEIAQTLDIPESQFQKALHLNLKLNNLDIHQIKLKENQALLRGSIQKTL